MVDDPDVDYFGLLIYGFLGILVISLSFVVFGFSNWVFQGQEIAAITAFGTALTGFTSILLIGIYRKQTQIFKRHGNILEKQTELMELEYTPDLCRISIPSFDGDSVTVNLSNIAKGYANNIRIITRVEFEGSISYSAPLEGKSPLNQIEDGDVKEGTNSLAPSGEAEFQALSLLSVGNSGNGDHRSFSQVVDNLAAEGVDWVRVSIEAEAMNRNGDRVTSCDILPEEYCYVTLDDVDEYTLESIYERSSPAK